MGGNKLTVSIDLDKLGKDLLRKNMSYIDIYYIASRFCVTYQTAGKILSSLARLGYLERWSRKLYRIRKELLYSHTCQY